MPAEGPFSRGLVLFGASCLGARVIARVRWTCFVAVVASAVGCGPDVSEPAQTVGGGQCPESSRFVTAVVDYEFGDGQSFGQDDLPEPVLGPPEGAGCCMGGTDVISLGNGGFVVLEFGDATIVDGPGPDFVVFENAFYVGGNEDDVFAELATVAVSADGEEWVEFPCSAIEGPDYGQCAGASPVFASSNADEIDPFDPDTGGGDPFDLADVGLSEARFVKITDRADLDGAVDGVFDLDAVALIHATCPVEADEDF